MTFRMVWLLAYVNPTVKSFSLLEHPYGFVTIYDYEDQHDHHQGDLVVAMKNTATITRMTQL